MFAAGKTAAVSAAGPDEKFNYVTMLLHGDGTNGAQNNTFVDSSTANSGSGWTVTRNGNATQGSFSPYIPNGYWSNYFDGSGDYFTIPDDGDLRFGSGEFTIEAWIFPTASVYGCIASKGNYPSSGYFEFRTSSSNKLELYDTNLGASITSTSSISLNKWSHVAVSRSGTTIKLFINGVADSSATDGGSFSNTGSFAIGSASQGGSYTNFFTGYISNLRVTSAGIYTSSFTPSTVPLTKTVPSGEGRLVTCQSNRFIDTGMHPDFQLTKYGDVSVQPFNPFGASTAYDTTTIGGSGYFDGNADWVSIANNSAFDLGSNNFTIEAWVYRTSNSGNQSICSKYEPSYQSSWSIDTNGNTWEVAIYYGSTSYVNVYTGGVPALNQWVHIALQRNGSYNEFYVNGSRVAQIAAQTIRTTTSAIRIGELGAGYSGYAFQGYIGDLRIVNGTAIYSGATYTVPTTPLTAVANTKLLLNMNNAGIRDNAMMCELETIGNAQVSTSVKKYGTGSMYFDGTGDALLAAPSALYNMGTGDFTIECWVYPQTQVQTYPGIITLTGTSDLSIAYDHGDTTNDSFSMLLGGTRTAASVTSAVDNWYYIAVVRSGSTVTLYINGTSRATATNSSTLGGTVCTIGMFGTGSPTTAFKGYIDDLRITKGYARYTTTFTPPTAALPDKGPVSS